MHVIIAQHNRAYAAFRTTSRQYLSAIDVERANALASENVAMESGYFDVLLLPGKVTAAQFSNAAVAVPRHYYTNARDHVIEVR